MIGISDPENKVFAIYAGQDEFTMAVTQASDRLTGLPNGSFSYAGLIATGERENYFESSFVSGDFSMNVNFANSYGVIRTNDDNPFQLNGNFRLTSTNGHFSGNDLSFSVGSSTLPSASIYGSFHGERASHVSGVFHDNQDNPVWSGIFVGTKQ